MSITAADDTPGPAAGCSRPYSTQSGRPPGATDDRSVLKATGDLTPSPSTVAVFSADPRWSLMGSLNGVRSSYRSVATGPVLDKIRSKTGVVLLRAERVRASCSRQCGRQRAEAPLDDGPASARADPILPQRQPPIVIRLITARAGLDPIGPWVLRRAGYSAISSAAVSVNCFLGGITGRP